MRLWDVGSQEQIATMLGRHGGALAFSPDGKTLASHGQDGTVILRNVETGEERNILRGRPGSVWCLAFSPGGKILAGGESDGTIALWDPDSMRERATLRHSGIVTSLAFAPDTSALISGSSDPTINRWEPLDPPKSAR